MAKKTYKPGEKSTIKIIGNRRGYVKSPPFKIVVEKNKTSPFMLKGLETTIPPKQFRHNLPNDNISFFFVEKYFFSEQILNSRKLVKVKKRLLYRECLVTSPQTFADIDKKRTFFLELLPISDFTALKHQLFFDVFRQ